MLTKFAYLFIDESHASMCSECAADLQGYELGLAEYADVDVLREEGFAFETVERVHLLVLSQDLEAAVVVLVAWMSRFGGKVDEDALASQVVVVYSQAQRSNLVLGWHTQVDAIEFLDFVVVDSHRVDPFDFCQPWLLDQTRLDEQFDVQIVEFFSLLLVESLVFNPGKRQVLARIVCLIHGAKDEQLVDRLSLLGHAVGVLWADMELLQQPIELLSDLWAQIFVDALHEMANQVLHQVVAVLPSILFMFELDVFVKGRHADITAYELAFEGDLLGDVRKSAREVILLQEFAFFEIRERTEQLNSVLKRNRVEWISGYGVVPASCRIDLFALVVDGVQPLFDAHPLLVL